MLQYSDFKPQNGIPVYEKRFGNCMQKDKLER